jgi:ribonuclease P protein component
VQIVDDFRNLPRSARLALGLVVPKRHARRAVTRTLLKRQMRAVFARHVARLPDGAWVLRLRAPFDRIQYPSAASARLRAVVRSELDGVVAACAQEAAA